MKQFYLDDFDDELAPGLIERIIYHPMEIAKMVKEIDFREDLVVHFEDGQRSLKILRIMYNRCSNIKSILSKFADHREELFWKLTLKATRKGKLKNLEMISASPHPIFFKSYYFPLVQEIRVRLKHIDIGSIISMTTSSNLKDIPNTFCDLLSKTDFPKLEGIDFAWASSISLMNCETITNCCSKYKSFKTLSLGISLNID